MLDQKQELEIQSKAHRFYILIAFVALLFSILLLRLFFLQIIKGDTLKEFSDNNRFKKQVLIPPRGLILDQKERVLVGNKKTYQLIINLNTSSSLEHVLKQVSPVIGEPVSNLKEKIEVAKKRYGVFHPVVLIENLSILQVHQLKQLQWLYPEIQARTIQKRFYPLKENGSQLFGFIGAVSKKDIQKLKNKKTFFYPLDIIGKSGLEKLYDNNLKGQHGFSMVEVDARNRLFTTKRADDLFESLKISPIQGEDLTLTLDKDLQEMALKALRRKDSLYPRTGAVLVMKTNGEILALLSEPGFDPNLLTFNVKEDLWKKLSSKDSKFFINKTYQEHYSPGSVFKPFIALAGLQEGLIEEESLIDSPSFIRVGNRLFHDHNRWGYGKINLVKAIERSSNTFFYQLARELKIETINNYIQLFNFGKKTNIKLPGESSGVLTNLEHAKKTGYKWQLGDTMNISIGQGPLLTTLLQLAVAYNAIATEGLMVQPFLVKKIGGYELTPPKEINILTDKIERRHFLSIKKALKQVVHGSQGTARGYRLAEGSFSGKTGTAQVISLDSKQIYKKCELLQKEHRHHGWFIGFAPSEKPEIVVAVFTENSCSGSKGSASVASDIVKYYFKNKRGG